MIVADAGELDILLVDVNPSLPPIPPLGLEVLASALSQAGFRAEIFSASPFLTDYAQQLDGLSKFHPRSVGLQIRNYDQAILRHDYPTLHSFHKSISRALGKLFPRAPLIVGGIGFSIDPQFWLNELNADFGIIGSGELPLTHLLGCVLCGVGEVDEIPGVVLRGKPANPAWVPERLSRVHRGHLEYERWRRPLEKGVPWANIETHRGCRFRCDFCVEPRIHGRKVVFKDPVDVVAELRELMNRGIHRFFFSNSEFNLYPSYALALCRSLAAAGLGERINWWTFVIPDRLPVDLCRSMKIAGCESISLNAVHVNDRILASFRCPHRRASYERCLESAAEAGLALSSTFLLGSSLETEATIEELLSFIDKRGLCANLSFGLANYPVLPRSDAMEGTPETRWFPRAGNGTIPYSLRLSPSQVAAVERWAWSRPSVQVQNRAPELAMMGTGQCPGSEFLSLIRDAAGVELVAGASAVQALRAALLLLDLPVVRLGTSDTLAGVTPEPGFLLYGPFHKLSRFYQALRGFLESQAATPEAIARLYLRLSVCAGEFPRLLDAGKDFLDADSHSWLLRKWEREQSLPQLTFAASYACQAHCPYCYAQDVDQYQPGELTLNSFLLAIDWAERQGCRIISFAGGEPTLHPLAEKFFEEVRLRGLRTYFNSNLLCDPDVIADFDGSWVTNIGIHAQAARFTPREQRVHFERNVEGLRSRGVPLFLRYTFEHQNEEAIGDALTLACTLGVKQVNFAIPMPSLSRRNRHAGEKQMRDSGHFLVRATEAFRAAGLTAILSKPIPPCAVPEDKLEFLRAGEAPSAACNLPRRGWTQNVLVAPDLTISPCVGVPTAGPSLLDFQSFHEVSEYLVRHLQSILRPTPFEECAACNFRLGGRCLGGCLAYFVEANQSEKGPLSQLRV